MAVVGELVITGQSDQTTEAGAKRVENLCSSISPNLAEKIKKIVE